MIHCPLPQQTIVLKVVTEMNANIGFFFFLPALEQGEVQIFHFWLLWYNHSC